MLFQTTIKNNSNNNYDKDLDQVVKRLYNQWGKSINIRYTKWQPYAKFFKVDNPCVNSQCNEPIKTDVLCDLKGSCNVQGWFVTIILLIFNVLEKALSKSLFWYWFT